MSARELGGRGERIGDLRLEWAYRLSSDDPRLGGITGLEVSGELGLLAVTDQRNWIAFDGVGPAFRNIRKIEVSPLSSAPSTPGGLRASGERMMMSFPDSDAIWAANVRRCQLAARPVEFLRFTPGSRVEFIAPIYFGYTAFGGRGSDGKPADMVTNLSAFDASAADVQTLLGHELPTHRGRLMDVAGAGQALDSSNFIALWRAEDRRPATTLQRFDLNQHGEYHRPNRSPKDLATLPVQLEAVAATTIDGQVLIFAATRSRPGEPTLLVALSYKG